MAQLDDIPRAFDAWHFVVAFSGWSKNMKVVTLKMTAEELQLLTKLAAEQLFRREFIDRNLSGSQANAAETDEGKKLVARMRGILDPAFALRHAGGLQR
jgi:hypothetical protein